MNPINEELLQYVFELRLFSPVNLKTCNGEDLKIIKTGIRNYNAGPDFSTALIKIDDIQLAGNIELHVKSSEWNRHKHSFDKAYDNVILHVVYEHDEEIYVKGKALPTLILKDRIFENVLSNYGTLISAQQNFSCEKSLQSVPQIHVDAMLDRVLIERFEKKSQLVESILAKTHNHWDEAFYQLLAYSFGFSVNKIPFLRLAELIPFSLVMKIRTNILKLEALLFGIAGYLKGEPVDDYTKSLQAEYNFLKHKFSLDMEMSKEEWRFSKMHPVNFPTIRIAQFAQVLHQNANLFSVIKEHSDFLELENMFTLRASEYWNTHFVFGKTSPKKIKKLGKDSIQILIINAVASLLFAFGKKDESYKEKAFELLNAIAAEENSTTKKYRAAGLKVENAYTSQALIQLKENYCDAKKCLHCRIGNYLTKT